MARTRDGRGGHEAADGRERSCRSRRLWPRASLASSNYFAVFLLLCNFTRRARRPRAAAFLAALRLEHTLTTSNTLALPRASAVIVFLRILANLPRIPGYLDTSVYSCVSLRILAYSLHIHPHILAYSRARPCSIGRQRCTSTRTVSPARVHTY